MRILLVAYEFPPSPSPQALRWAYLTRELAARGHEVHVLAPMLPGDGKGLPDTGPGVAIHRVHAGPIIGLVAERAKDSAGGAQPPALVSGAIDERVLHERASRKPQVHLNWKGRLFQRVKAIAGYALFPDIRGEWTRGAKRALNAHIAAWRPDIVVTSHEPANTLELGLQASQADLSWVADLGDPVLAPYTPRRWRRHARALERKVWRTADAVTVTTSATAELLQARHGTPRGACTVLPQGYDRASSDAGAGFPELFEHDILELLYTGSFYRFREPTRLIEAVLATPGVRLTIASMSVPPAVIALAERHPEQLRLLGFLRHTDVLALQRAADVLVNIGNHDPSQIPGKFFEYLGSGRPVLHVGPRRGEHAAELLERTGAGWVCENDASAIAEILSALRDEHRTGCLGAGLVRNEATLACYRWDRIAEACETVLAAALLGHATRSMARTAVHQQDPGISRL